MTDDPKQVAVDAFLSDLNDAAGVYAVSISGVGKFRAFLESFTFPNPDPSTPFSFGTGDPSTPDGVAYQRWPQGDLSELLARDGEIITSLGQQWIVMVFALWEEEHRVSIAKAFEVDVSEILDDVMGDIRHLRNDVIHHRGIATIGNAAKCLELKWFAPGDEIRIEDKHIVQVMDHWRLTWRPGAKTDP